MERYTWIQDTYTVKADPIRVLEHSLDIARLMYLHPSDRMAKWAVPPPQSKSSFAWATWKHKAKSWLPWRKDIPAPTLAEAFTYELRPTNLGFTVFTPPHPEISDINNLPRDTFRIDFLNPDRIWIQKLNKSKLRGGINDFHMISHYVPIMELDPLTGKPTGAVHTRAEFAYTVRQLPGFKLGRAPLSKPYIRSPFLKKDLAAVEATQAAVDATKAQFVPPQTQIEGGLTAIQTALHHVLKLAEEDKWNEEARAQLPQSTILKHWAAQTDYDNKNM
jgi:hypothetical protein